MKNETDRQREREERERGRTEQTGAGGGGRLNAGKDKLNRVPDVVQKRPLEHITLHSEIQINFLYCDWTAYWFV